MVWVAKERLWFVCYWYLRLQCQPACSSKVWSQFTNIRHNNVTSSLHNVVLALSITSHSVAQDPGYRHQTKMGVTGIRQMFEPNKYWYLFACMWDQPGDPPRSVGHAGYSGSIHSRAPGTIWRRAALWTRVVESGIRQAAGIETQHQNSCWNEQPSCWEDWEMSAQTIGLPMQNLSVFDISLAHLLQRGDVRRQTYI